MKFQNVYECRNLDYEATLQFFEKLGSFRREGLGGHVTEKGLIVFRIPKTKIKAEISPKGKVVVAWQDVAEKQIFLPVLEGLLRTYDNSRAKLEPLKGNLTNIPYPPPSELIFAWCREKFRYFHNLGFFTWWERRAQRKLEERRIERLTNIAIASQFSEMAKEIWGVDLGINPLLSELKAIYERDQD